MSNIWQDGMIGFIVGDALGVPVEFSSRGERRLDPVVGMRAYGTHSQPMGTWSDDSSMTLATLDSIQQCGGISYEDLMDAFVSWYKHGDYTPFDEVFDIGIATSRAIRRYCDGTAPLEAGGRGERDNGNGSLMRMLPVCLYLYCRQKLVCTSEDECIYMIHNVSALTHGHLRSQIACGIYYFLVKAVIDGMGSLLSRLQKGMDDAYGYYRRDITNFSELRRFDRLTDLSAFQKLSERDISSSGYVVDTLEAVIWCLLNRDTYEKTVLKAVNLGDDTDTVAAIAGSLAGLYYGYDEIPKEWIDALQRKELIDAMLMGY